MNRINLIIAMSIFLSIEVTYAQENDVDIKEVTITDPVTGAEMKMIAQKREEYYIAEGDIIVGRVKDNSEKSAFLYNSLWSDNTIYYKLDQSVKDNDWLMQRFNSAVDEINNNNNNSNSSNKIYLKLLNWEQHTSQPYYVTIKEGNECSASIGRNTTDNTQNEMVLAGPGCGRASIIHEFLHTAGFSHTQSREDRDSYVTIHWDNIIDSLEFNFNKRTIGYTDYSNIYDYNSIMHYSWNAFAIDDKKATITALNGQSIGGATGLSSHDKNMIRNVYPPCINEDRVYSNIIHSARLKTNGDITITGYTEEGTWARISAGDKISLEPGASIKAGNGGRIEMRLTGCNVD